LDDIFDLQEQLARKIVEAFRIVLTPDEDNRLTSRPISDLRAYDAWLRARPEMWKFSKDGIQRATEHLERAQEITGDNALLHAALGYIHATSYDFGISHTPETLQLADRHSSKALQLDPTLGLALFASGYVRFKKGDFEGVVSLLRRATEQDHNTETLCILGIVLGVVGKIDEARKMADEAVAVDPLYVFTRFTRALVDFFDGEYGAAHSRFQEILHDLSPDDPMILWWLAQTMAHAGRRADAREVFAQVADTDALLQAALSELYCRAADGDRRAVARQLEEKTFMVECAETDEWFPNFIANCLALVGDEDGAVYWLGRAIGFGFCNHRYLEEYNPFLKPLHGNPRFQKLIDKARQKHEAFDV
jgi:tetratricopeptide (TPR) repeat protein